MIPDCIYIIAQMRKQLCYFLEMKMASEDQTPSFQANTRIRTGDLILTKDVLYQLSHISIPPTPSGVSGGYYIRNPLACQHRFLNQSSQFPTVRGKGITSLMFDTPVRYMTQRSNPSPNPACLAVPYFLRSR